MQHLVVVRELRHDDGNGRIRLRREVECDRELVPAEDAIPEYLAYRPIVELSSGVAAGANHPLVARRSAKAADFADYPWVVIQHDRDLVNNILAALATADGHSADQRRGDLAGLAHPNPPRRNVLELVRRRDRGDARPWPGARPYDQRIVRGQAGVVYHRSLERYGPALRLIELVEAAAVQMRL